ncbi:MAG: RNA-binding cell elongation regulator Jag/EloR [Bacilli bacterium]
MDIKKVEFAGRNYELALLKAEEEFCLSEEEMIIEVISDGNKGILGVGSKDTVISVIPYSYISVYAEEFVKEILTHFNLDNIVIDSSFNNNIICVRIDCDNNGVLIGKNGKTLNSLIHIITQAIRRQLGQYVKVSVDVGDYKDARVKQLERLAHNVSRSVAKTRVETKLEPMNSYERRIIHSYLAKDKYVTTISEGDEPNRYVVIKLK